LGTSRYKPPGFDFNSSKYLQAVQQDTPKHTLRSVAAAVAEEATAAGHVLLVQVVAAPCYCIIAHPLQLVDHLVISLLKRFYPPQTRLPLYPLLLTGTLRLDFCKNVGQHRVNLLFEVTVHGIQRLSLSCRLCRRRSSLLTKRCFIAGCSKLDLLCTFL
jgi:hypothetical protein